MLTRVDGQTSRRAFLGLAAAGVAGAVSACSGLAPPPRPRPAAATARAWRNPVPENSLPGTSDWVIRHLGAEHEIEGYAGKASVLAGRAAPAVRVDDLRGRSPSTAYRLGWYQGHGARQVWKSKTVRGGAQRAATVSEATSTVTHRLGPGAQRAHRRLAGRGVPAQAGRRVRRAAVRAGHRPVAVLRGQGRAQGLRADLAGVQHLGRLRPVQGADGAYADRSLVVSLDRPYDDNGANMFLTYERNVVKLAEYLTTRAGRPRPGVRDEHGHPRRPAPARRGERADLPRPRRVLDAAGARERHRRPRQGRQPGLPRRERAVPPDPPAGDRAGRGAPGGLLQDRLPRGPGVREGPAGGHQRLARAARTPTRSRR